MKCKILFSGENKKNGSHLSSAELAQTVVKVKGCHNYLKLSIPGKYYNRRLFIFLTFPRIKV